MLKKKTVNIIIIVGILIFTGLILAYNLIDTSNGIIIDENTAAKSFGNNEILQYNNNAHKDKCTITIKENKLSNLFTNDPTSWTVTKTCYHATGDSVDATRWINILSYENEEWKSEEKEELYKCMKWRSSNLWQDYFFGSSLCN